MHQAQLFETPQETRTSDDYWTPKWIFDAIGLTFDLDVACPPEGPAHTPCHAYYTQADNGLASPWHGRVFMNPPYSNASAWVNKWLDHGNGIAITVVGKSKWADRLWAESDGIVLLKQNMHFVQGRIPWPIIISAIGHDNTQAIAALGRVR
jgi:phage N-6-adenine-methyltransferase